MAGLCKRIASSCKSLGKLHLRAQTQTRPLTVLQGDVKTLAPAVQSFIEESAKLCQPDNIHICDGTEKENTLLMQLLEREGIAKKLHKYENCYLTTTDPADVARVEGRTFMSTHDKRDTLPDTKNGAKCQVGNWISPDDLDTTINERYPGCMKGRTMYVIPFSMGPIGSPLSKIGVEITDSPYVVASMRIMTRIGENVLNALGGDKFVKCLHSVGVPLPTDREIKNHWPCNPEKTIIAHRPDRNEIVSYGSGYGGNSLLGKKCFALRLGSILARNEGWMAEHMLILGLESPNGTKKYIAAAFPSACGKTNLAMMKPSLPGYKVTCVGDDIAWMRFDNKGQLRAINPEAGFFGVAPGTSMKTNPIAMETIQHNTLFTNVAHTSDGGIFWEGLEGELDDGVGVKSWLGEDWTRDSKSPAAHPNSRFCTPAGQCPIMDEAWESSEGVPISAIVFGGRRPSGFPLVFEAFNWTHGVFVGASMRSEATAAAEHKAKVLLNDPFAMRPFFGYNFGHYLKHWLSLQSRSTQNMPKIFHVNWFRRDDNNRFLWPGFGENVRVLDWICRRVDGDDIAQSSPIGYIPKLDSLNMNGLKEPVDLERLFELPKDFWLQETSDIRKYLDEQVNADLPPEMWRELDQLEERISKML